MATSGFSDRHYGFVPKAAGDDWVRACCAYAPPWPRKPTFDRYHGSLAAAHGGATGRALAQGIVAAPADAGKLQINE